MLNLAMQTTMPKVADDTDDHIAGERAPSAVERFSRPN
jgi:hypothetical protein